MTMAMTMLALPPRHGPGSGPPLRAQGPLEVPVDVCLKPKCSPPLVPSLDIACGTAVSRTLHTSPRTVIAGRRKQSGASPQVLPAYGPGGLPAAAQGGTTAGSREALVRGPESTGRPRRSESQGRASEERADGDLDPHMFMSPVRRVPEVQESTSRPK